MSRKEVDGGFLVLQSDSMMRMAAECQFTASSSPILPECGKSWNDLRECPPTDPRELILWADITRASAAFVRSATYFSETWLESPFSIDPLVPTCQALGTDSQQEIADAIQWNFAHGTARVDAATPLPLRTLLFLRAGERWLNVITIDLDVGTGNVYNDLQLSFLENAATRGDCQGTIPVIAFTGGDLMDRIVLSVVLKRTGRFQVGLRAVDQANNVSMFEMEWVVVK